MIASSLNFKELSKTGDCNLIRISTLRLLALRELRTLYVAGGIQVYSVAGGMQVYSVAGGIQVYSVAGGIQVYSVAGGVQVYSVAGGVQVYSVTNYSTCCFLLHLQLYKRTGQTDRQTDN